MLVLRNESQLTLKENEILNDYCMYQSFYNHSRQQFKKEIITPYNKEQKKLKGKLIRSYYLLERDYPQLVNYYSKLYNISDLSLLFENNFTKLVQNTFLIPSFQIKTYGNRQYNSYVSVGDFKVLCLCYQDGSVFINKINKKLYTINSNQQLVDSNSNMYSFYYLKENMHLFAEIKT